MKCMTTGEKLAPYRGTNTTDGHLVHYNLYSDACMYYKQGRLSLEDVKGYLTYLEKGATQEYTFFKHLVLIGIHNKVRHTEILTQTVEFEKECCLRMNTTPNSLDFEDRVERVYPYVFLKLRLFYGYDEKDLEVYTDQDVLAYVGMEWFQKCYYNLINNILETFKKQSSTTE